jgi:uncharacterized protein (DUF2126 family)
MTTWMEQAAAEAEARLQREGIALTLGGEPTYVPSQPDGAEWQVAADGPTKLARARAMAAAIQARTWSGSTLLFCSGKRYEGEVNPRWALRLITGADGTPIAPWPEASSAAGADASQPLPAALGPLWLKRLGQALGLTLQALPLSDPREPQRRVWAVPLTSDPDGERWSSQAWPLADALRQLSLAPGPAGLRLPLQHWPEALPCQLLTLEIGPSDWGLYLPPLQRQPIETLLRAISGLALVDTGEGGNPLALTPPELSGQLPVDAHPAWQVLGLSADPGVLEINLPVCHSWAEYRDWLLLLDQAGAAVDLRSWKRDEHGRQGGTGGGNHLLWGGPELERHPFFPRPAWLVGILRYFQHHPSLSYLFAGPGVGPSSQAPRADEALGGLTELELAYRVLERSGPGDQRQLLGETLRHLHADRSGNNHRCEISVDKFWNPGAPAGCLGLVEFRAIETLPRSDWMAAIALLWSCLAAMLLEPARRPAALRPWGEALHDRMLLPSQLWADLEQVLQELAAAGLMLQPEPFRQIWEWRFPALLHWEATDGQLDGEGASLELRPAPEPWPLICDTPLEGGTTSRFVDASLRRIEVITNAAFRRRYQLRLQGRDLPLPAGDQPLAVRYRQQRLYPCLHPGIAPQTPLLLEVLSREPGSEAMAAGRRIIGWSLDGERVQPSGAPGVTTTAAPAWQSQHNQLCSIDLRQADADLAP